MNRFIASAAAVCAAGILAAPTQGGAATTSSTITASSSATTTTVSSSSSPSAPVTLPSGTISEDLVVGTGPEAKVGSNATVNYTGTLENGTVFDSSKKPGRSPFQLTNLGHSPVIKGWNEGVVGMKVGGKRKLTIPSDAAYGPQGRPPVIPPNATLIFEIDLLGVN